jgi:SAM-dependent methyltransferase
MNLFFGPWLDNFPDALTPGQTALDIGCGHGYDTRILLAAGLHVVALDLDPSNIRRATANAPRASFAVADLRTGLPFRDGTFNLAVASLSLHYFDRATTERILHDIHRVTTPDATLLARVNTVGDTASLWGVGIEHEQDFFEVEPGHFKRFYTETSLREALAPHFDINQLFPMAITVNGLQPKQTLVARATRRDP